MQQKCEKFASNSLKRKFEQCDLYQHLWSSETKENTFYTVDYKHEIYYFLENLEIYSVS